MAADGSVVIEIVGDDRQFERSLNSLDKTASSALKGLEVMAKVATVAIVGATAAAVKFGAEFESTMAATSTMFGDVAVDTQGLTSKILDLSNASGVAASEINQSLYDALSSGIPVTEDMGAAMDYMESSVKLAAAGFTDINTATMTTAKVMNAYGMAVSDVDKINKILIQTQNFGITTVDELGATLAQVTPTAAAMGVSFEQVGAALSVMTAQGTPTAQATTQLNSLIAELGKNGTLAAGNLEKATKGTKFAGKSFTELMNAGVPLNEVLDVMDSYAKKGGKSLIDMFSSIESGKSALSIAGKNSASYAKALSAMSTSADVVGEAYDKVTDTLEHKIGTLKESVKNLGIAVYENAKGPLKNAAQGLTDMANGAAKALPSMLASISKNFDLITTAAKMAVGAVVAFKAASIVGNLVVVYQKAALQVALFAAGQSAAAIKTGISTGALAVHEVAVGVLTGKIGLATAAQGLWNAVTAANPIGMVALAAAALTVAIIGVVSATERGTDAEEAARKATEARNEAIKSRAKAWEEGKGAQQESIDASLSEIAMAESYIGELRNITDESGHVKAGYEGRAKALYELTNAAIPGAISANQDEAGSIYQVSTAIDEVIRKKKAEAVLSAMEPQYEEASKNWIQAQKDEAIAEREVNDARANSTITLREGIVVVKDEFKKKEEAYAAAKDQVNSYYSEMANYEDLLAASLSGSSDKIESALGRVTTNFQASGSASVEALQQQVRDIEAAYQTMLTSVQNGNTNISQAQLDSMRKLLDEAKAELQKGLEKQNATVKNESATFSPTYAAGLSSGSGLISKALSNITLSTLQDLDKSASGFGKAGAMAAQKNADGIMSGAGNVSKATEAMTNNAKLAAEETAGTMSGVGTQMGDGVIVGLQDVAARVGKAAADMALAALNAAKAAVGIHSPSKDFEEQVGAQMVAGAVEGIVKNTTNATKKAEDLSRDILSAATKWVDERKFFDALALENEAEFWDNMSKVAALSAEDRLEAEKKAYTARANIAKGSYENSKKWIEKEKFYNRLSAQEEVAAWERVVQRKNLLTEQQIDAERNLYSAQQRLLEDQKAKAEAYERDLSTRADSLRSFAGLFEDVDKKTEASGRQLLKNLQDQVNQFEGWQADMETLSAKGVAGPLLDKLQELGPRAASEIHAMTQMTKDELSEYTGLFDRLGKDASDQAEKELSGTALELPVGMAVISKEQATVAVENSVGAISAAVTASTEGLKKTAGTVASAMCDTITSKQSDFFSVGINAMKGFNDGLELQGQMAIATARRIADEIISTMQFALDIHSPSRKMRDLVGKPTAQGFMVGFEDEMAHFGRMAQETVDRETGRISAQVSAQTDGRQAAQGITREVHNSTNTVEKVARIEGDGVTGELVRMLGLRIKTEDKRVGDSFV